MQLQKNLLPGDYSEWLADLKKRIAGARQRAALAVNAELVRLYHDIGGEILQRQEEQGWGARVIERLSADLRAAFPDIKGFSTTNLKYMKHFARECPDLRIGQQPVDQLPWSHLIILLSKVPEAAAREWYALHSAQQGWSRDTLHAQIKSQAYLRQGSATTNFERRLSAAVAPIAQAALKDPYLFDFLGLEADAVEQDIENALVRHIARFLLELGTGFAFVGRQFRLEVEGEEFFIDLLFYHTRLKCYVVVELKAGAFKPEHSGQLNFYLAAVDAQVKAPDDPPTIGLLLCKTKTRLVAEYALSGIEKPIGIAEYQLVRTLPTPLDTSLPSIEQIEEELSTDLELMESEGMDGK